MFLSPGRFRAKASSSGGAASLRRSVGSMSMFSTPRSGMTVVCGTSRKSVFR
ncbi:hypothetical protein ACFOEY_06885 [Paracandidimonas soli]|uniref:hypothetical protein n=1 Tax=Paracandidimonas soli TaxID=1917182 RepID=UPI003621C3DD